MTLSSASKDFSTSVVLSSGDRRQKSTARQAACAELCRTRRMQSHLEILSAKQLSRADTQGPGANWGLVTQFESTAYCKIPRLVETAWGSECSTTSPYSPAANKSAPHHMPATLPTGHEYPRHLQHKKESEHSPITQRTHRRTSAPGGNILWLARQHTKSETTNKHEGLMDTTAKCKRFLSRPVLYKLGETRRGATCTTSQVPECVPRLRENAMATTSDPM